VTPTRLGFGGTYYSASTYCEACNKVNGNFVTLYTTGSCINDEVNEYFYLNDSLTMPAGPGGISWTGVCSNASLHVGSELLPSGRVVSYNLCDYMCVTPTPTKTVTPTVTPTISLTPSITPSVTPSIAYYFGSFYSGNTDCDACKLTGSTTLYNYRYSLFGFVFNNTSPIRILCSIQ
jgi:hypothetical protein